MILKSTEIAFKYDPGYFTGVGDALFLWSLSFVGFFQFFWGGSANGLLADTENSIIILSPFIMKLSVAKRFCCFSTSYKHSNKDDIIWAKDILVDLLYSLQLLHFFTIWRTWRCCCVEKRRNIVLTNKFKKFFIKYIVIEFIFGKNYAEKVRKSLSNAVLDKNG